jgi:hypothetical protein
VVALWAPELVSYQAPAPSESPDGDRARQLGGF